MANQRGFLSRPVAQAGGTIASMHNPSSSAVAHDEGSKLPPIPRDPVRGQDHRAAFVACVSLFGGQTGKSNSA